MATRTQLPTAAQELLDGILSDDVNVWWDGQTFIAGNRRGLMSSRRVGRQVASLRARGLVTPHGRLLLTEAGIDAASVPGDRDAAILAYRLRTAPKEVMRSEPLMPHPMYVAPTPTVTDARDGFETFDITDHLVASADPSEPDQWSSDVIIMIGNRGRSLDWHMIGFCGPESVTRRVHQGPLLKGVYAYAFAKGVVIDNHGGSGRELAEARGAGKVVDASIGDVLVMRGYPFVIESERNDNIKLTRMADENGQPMTIG